MQILCGIGAKNDRLQFTMIAMQNEQNNVPIHQRLIGIINRLLLVIFVLVAALAALPFVFYFHNQDDATGKNISGATVANNEPGKTGVAYWTAADITSIADKNQKEKVEYGRELIAHTARYIGPNGSVLKTGNGMNCQNCHLEAGTKVWGNNYGSVASLYPKLRARSGGIENVYKRVNDCFERSLYGKALDTTGKEIQSIVAYINFVGSNVPKGQKAEGSGFKDMAYLDRAADPAKGQIIYSAKCQRCHQSKGEGQLDGDKTEFTYPALWGNNSYTDAAGLYRIINFAKYVKNNMPQGATFENPQLTDEEAWDVAAFVNTQLRPHLTVPKDWPDISKKPIDHPFGPYTDHFAEQQHKYGPYKPIADEQKKKGSK